MATETTPDLSEFIGLSKPKKAPCQVGEALKGLQPVQADQLRAACSTDKAIITAGAIGKWLAARELRVTNSAIAHHRQGNCSCGR
jgi:hypothetical protein